MNEDKFESVLPFNLKKINWYLKIAKTISEMSPDEETQVGCVLVDKNNGSIIATGYNGFAKKAPDHLLPKTRPDKYKYMIHAEENLIAQCAYKGESVKDGILFTTMSPCIKCMRLMYQCGIKKIITTHIYKDMEEIVEMIDIKVSILPVGNFSVIEYL